MISRRALIVLLWCSLLATMAGARSGEAAAGITGKISIMDSARYTSDTTGRVDTANTTCTVTIRLLGPGRATATVTYSAQSVQEFRSPGDDLKVTTRIKGSGSATYTAGAPISIGQDGTYTISVDSPVITVDVTSTREATNRDTTTSTSTEPVRCTVGNGGVLAGRLGRSSILNGSQTSYGRYGHSGEEYGSSKATWSITDPLYRPDPTAPLPPAPKGPPPGVFLSGSVNVNDKAAYDNSSSAQSTSLQTNCTVDITLNQDGSATATATYNAHAVTTQSSTGTEYKLTTDVQGTGTFYYAALATASIAEDGSYRISIDSPVLTASVTTTREQTNQPTTTTITTEEVRCQIGNGGTLSGRVDKNSTTLKGGVTDHGRFGNSGQETGTSDIRWVVVDVYIVIKVGGGNGRGGSPSATPTLPPATSTATPTPPSPTPTATPTVPCASVAASITAGPARIAAQSRILATAPESMAAGRFGMRAGASCPRSTLYRTPDVKVISYIDVFQFNPLECIQKLKSNKAILQGVKAEKNRIVSAAAHALEQSFKKDWLLAALTGCAKFCTSAPETVIEACGGLVTSANPPPPARFTQSGPGSWQSFRAPCDHSGSTCEYRGYVHFPNIEFRALKGRIVGQPRLVTPAETSYGYTKLASPGRPTTYDHAESYIPALNGKNPFKGLQNFTMRVSGGRLVARMWMAARLAQRERDLNYKWFGYDAPFIFLDVTETVTPLHTGGFAVSVAMKRSEFPDVKFYIDDQSLAPYPHEDLVDFMLHGGAGVEHPPHVGPLAPAGLGGTRYARATVVG